MKLKEGPLIGTNKNTAENTFFDFVLTINNSSILGKKNLLIVKLSDKNSFLMNLPDRFGKRGGKG